MKAPRHARPSRLVSRCALLLAYLVAGAAAASAATAVGRLVPGISPVRAAAAADPSWWWTIAGPASITLMFALISVPMMDHHLLGGRPGYARRMRERPALVPRPRVHS